MKIKNSIPSFLSSILCVYLLRIFWSLIVGSLLLKFGCTLFFDTIEYLSPFISYWLLKKYFSNNAVIHALFFDYVSVKKYAISLFVIESIILLLLLILTMNVYFVIYA